MLSSCLGVNSAWFPRRRLSEKKTRLATRGFRVKPSRTLITGRTLGIINHFPSAGCCSRAFSPFWTSSGDMYG